MTVTLILIKISLQQKKKLYYAIQNPSEILCFATSY